MTTKALALLSGGLDSILAKAAAREKAPTYHLGGGNCTYHLRGGNW